ncbi:hypothetical protein I7I50_05073 [Histoplasma capsulatum G186AR]|uniref:Uncharacterized protein n=1 Tax=Ajellomyces capsulatus TaxID=5037 RepID=A0A8H7Z8T9_AJECA|nr:hypothetical protein I7I52_03331 [Histoplasma capsulatum]QSS75810.1 hypothetical protein I7I50_05073 [Histoplasma capsulatum G186AR]
MTWISALHRRLTACRTQKEGKKKKDEGVENYTSSSDSQVYLMQVLYTIRYKHLALCSPIYLYTERTCSSVGSSYVHFICIFYSPPLVTPYLKPAYTVHMSTTIKIPVLYQVRQLLSSTC